MTNKTSDTEHILGNVTFEELNKTYRSEYLPLDKTTIENIGSGGGCGEQNEQPTNLDCNH